MANTSSTLDAGYLEAESILQWLAHPVASAVSDNEFANRAGADRMPAATSPPPTFVWTEAALRGLLESLPDALLVINGNGVIVHVNEQTNVLFGYTSDELCGQLVEVLIPEAVRDKHVKHRKMYFANPHGRPMGIGLELFGRHKHGGELPVEISLIPLPRPEGLFAIAIIRDITLRKKAEAKFRSLVENIPAVTFFAPLDESAPQLYVSPQIEALVGFSQEEWLSDPVLWYRQLHPEDRERWNVQFAPTCSAGRAFKEVYRFVAKDGRVVWVHAAANLVRDNEGQPLFLQGVAFDITEQKRYAEQLEERVAERTMALKQSLAALEEKTGELEQFAYVSSHDLRQPLRSLINYPQKLVKEYADRLDEQALDWLNKTISGAERMRRLIDDLLQYSRVIRRDRDFEAIDCNEVVQIVCSNLQADIEQSGAVVTAGDLPTVSGYQAHLLVLLQNLIANAIKFRAPDRVARVDIAARRDEDNWLFSVQDNGIGIEEKYLKRIFELGERLHPQTRYPGTGFGLAICEKIVDGHGGRIWVESQPEQGSCFYFTLRS